MTALPLPYRRLFLALSLVLSACDEPEPSAERFHGPPCDVEHIAECGGAVRCIGDEIVECDATAEGVRKPVENNP